MATCQQAGGGNIILKRKAASFSPCMLVWERKRGREKGLWTRQDAWLHMIGTTSPTLVSFVSLSHPSPVCFRPALWPGSPSTAAFTVALRCLRWCPCSEHTKVRHSYGHLFMCFLVCHFITSCCSFSISFTVCGFGRPDQTLIFFLSVFAWLQKKKNINKPLWAHLSFSSVNTFTLLNPGCEPLKGMFWGTWWHSCCPWIKIDSSW